MTTDIGYPETARRLRCALFVDFDNVYLGLRRLDPAAAEEFAGSPGRWLSALESGSDADGDFSRRFLIRSCYLNPSAFSQFRPNFTRAGFSVVDCPSLTQQGKSSADINLVLDAVDALAASTHYDEFVILSADADFTPLALRCRAADRRVTIITAGPAASAYRAVADTVVTADELAELVRDPDADAAGDEIATTAPSNGGRSRRAATTGGATADPAAAPAEKAPSRRRRGGATAAAKKAAAAPAADVLPDPLADAASDPTSEVASDAAPDGAAGDAGSGAGIADDATPAAPTKAPRRRASRATGAGSRGAAEAVAEPIAERVAESPARRAVLRQVRSADRPLRGGLVARAAQNAEPGIAAGGWEGAGAFFPWIAREVPEVAASPEPAPGFVWDPERFSEADLPGASVALPPLQRQVVDVTDIPNLPTDRYRVLLTALADDLADQPFDRPETARRVRDACQAAGQPIGRSSVNTVIAGVLYAGLDLSATPTAAQIAETWADNVIGLCRGARMVLSPADVAAIRAWVGGGLVAPRT
ncbi:NYN domain-containing protein [Actinotalea solisilvae]|uniref:NYN domain-containing protein n=1 Tax=Actinotalea solisilvae TaxID=2072922 RepID=UPI0027DC6081|nr:NYN domain-containing protein [Actinotalea solisilvae]